MKNQDFKNLLKESILLEGYNIFLEADEDGDGEAEPLSEKERVYKTGRRYAGKQYFRKIEKKWKENSSDIQKSWGLNKIQREKIFKDFDQIIKHLKLEFINKERWVPIFKKYNEEKSEGPQFRWLWDIIQKWMKLSKEANLSNKEYGEFSEREVFKLVKKIEDAKTKIEGASGELNLENLSILFKYFAIGRYFAKSDDIKSIFSNFDEWVKITVQTTLNNEGSIQRLFNDLKTSLQQIKIYNSSAAGQLSKLYKDKKFKSLKNLNDYIEKEPRGIKNVQKDGYWNASVGKKINKNIESEKKMKKELSEAVIRESHDINKYLKSFLPFAKDRLGYDKDPEMIFKSDPENGDKTLGKTAYYEPARMTITIYTDQRHPKDIMRSLSHELVHHSQNCDGQFDQMGEMEEGYAQNDEHLRKMEEDAYLRGNMCFRDWEDGYKQTNQAFGNQLQERRERLYYELLRRFK